MSDPGNSRRPLTRREIREREEAARRAAAAQHPQAAGPGGAPQGAGYPSPQGGPTRYSPPASRPAAGRLPSHGAHVTPSPTPQARPEPPATRTAPPSRRTIRQATGPQPVSEPPAIRPPAGSSGMRSLDETGRLTPVQQTGEQPIRPAAPVRQSSLRPASHQGTPGTPPPARPRQTPGNAPGVGVSANPGPGAVPGQASEPPRLSAFAPPAQDAGPTAPFAPVSSTTQASTWPAPPTSEPSYGSPPSAAEPASFVSQGTGRSPFEPVGDQAVEGAQAIDQGAARSPFEPINDQAADELAEQIFPATSAKTEAKASGNAKKAGRTERPPAHRFAWMRYVILIIAFFVFGILVWKLVLDGSASLGLAPTIDSIVLQSGPLLAPNGVL